MIKQIKYILFLFLFCFSCCTEEPTEVEEITYSTGERSKFGMIGWINSLYFLTPEVGFSFMDVYENPGKYPIGRVFRQTTDGGKTWETLSFLKENFTGIQYWDGVFYAYYKDSSNHPSGSSLQSSHLFFSNDMGKTWEKLYEFDGEISDFHVFDAQNMSVIKTEDRIKYIYQSRDGGKTWNKAEGAPDLGYSSYYPRDGNKLYFVAGKDGSAFRETSICSYDVITGELSTCLFKTRFFYIFSVSDGMLSTDMNGCDMKYFALKGDKFRLRSKIKWGAWRRGSVSSKPLAKDGKYVFSFISQYPGREGMTSALFFSETGGKRWREIRTFGSDGIGFQEYNIYRDDTTFQIAYPSLNSLKIFRIKKR